MTTCAWDGKTLAADSRITADGIITTDSFNKIKLLNCEYLGDRLLVMGVAGTANQFETLAYNLNNNIEDRDFLTEVSAIIVGLNYVYELESGAKCLLQFPLKTKLAIGSGGLIALSGMRLKLNAKDAVKHAITMDCGSGGIVSTWRNKKSPI